MTISRSKAARALRGTCVTGKQRYRNGALAKDALERALADKSPKRAEEAFYRCPHCAGWHLTHLPKGSVSA